MDPKPYNTENGTQHLYRRRLRSLARVKPGVGCEENKEGVRCQQEISRKIEGI